MAGWLDGHRLPEGWAVAQLRRLGHLVNGGTPPSEDTSSWGGHIPFITPPDLNGLDGAEIETTGRFLTDSGALSSGTAPPGSVIVSTRAPIGHVARVKQTSTFNQGCRAIVPSADVDSRYLAAVIVAARPELAARGNGTTFTEISATALAGVPVPFPPFPEQRAIADFLGRETVRIDALMSKQLELIERLRERRIAITTSAALSGLDQSAPTSPRDTRRWGVSLALDDAMRSLPAHWGLKRFRWVTAQRDERNVSASEVMLSLRITGMVVDRSETGNNQAPSDDSVPRYLVARPGDLVINPMWLTGGSIGVSEMRGAVSPDYRVFEVRKELDPMYLHAVLRSQPYFDQYKLLIRANTTFDRRVKQVDIDNLPIPIPPMDEQKEIVAYIRAKVAKIDATIAKVGQHVTLAEERRVALITDAVTGRIEAWRGVRA